MAKLLSETVIPESRLRLVASPEDAPDAGPRKVNLPPPVKDDPEVIEARKQRQIAVMTMSIGMLTALARVVSARLILLIAILGCFSLGVLATFKPTTQGLIALGLFGLVTVALILLESGLLERIGMRE
jgi:hypothetical protein